jgi:uncharacterized ferredoxin-like protein
MNDIIPLLATAIRTAPKSKGFDDILLERKGSKLLVGVKTKKADKVNCGYCGLVNCKGFEKALKQGKDVNCAFKIMDLGTALGSAYYTANKFNKEIEIKYIDRKKNNFKECDLFYEIELKREFKNKEINLKFNKKNILEKQTINFAADLIDNEIKNSNYNKHLKTKFIDEKELKNIVKVLNLYLFYHASRQKAFKLIGKTKGKHLWFLESDKEALSNSDGVYAIGVTIKNIQGVNCGLCGFETCSDFLKNSDKRGACMFRIFDLSFATGLAVSILADLRIDNRIMFTAGEAVRKTKLKDSDVVLGIGLSVKGANIFFDRYLRYFVNKARQTGKSMDKILEERGISVSNNK